MISNKKTTLSFSKYQGLGNDFILLEKAEIPNIIKLNRSFIQHLCNRRFGIGADGVLIYSEIDRGKSVKMEYFNSDGNLAETCINGVRCIGLHAVRSEGAKDKEEFSIINDSGIIQARVEGKTVSLTLDGPSFPELNSGSQSFKEFVNQPLDFSFGSIHGTYLTVGNPHFVSWNHDLELRSLNQKVIEIGTEVERSQFFPNGVNFEIAAVKKEDTIEMAVWERGAGHTLACGSGAAATICAGVKMKILENDRFYTVQMQGGALKVNANLKTNSIQIRGTATHVFTGTIEV